MESYGISYVFFKRSNIDTLRLPLNCSCFWKQNQQKWTKWS